MVWKRWGPQYQRRKKKRRMLGDSIPVGGQQTRPARGKICGLLKRVPGGPVGGDQKIPGGGGGEKGKLPSIIRKKMKK